METPLSSRHPFPDGQPESSQPKWRRDFPIDVEADEYGARRDFTKFMVLTSLAFACGQCWIAVQSLFRRGQPARQRIAAVEDLTVGQAVAFHYPTSRDPCLLMRMAEDQFLAFSSQCTHLMCPVIPDLKENKLHCPCHAGYFNATTGEPTAGPPRRPLPQIELEIVEGEIFATNVKVRPS